MKRFLFVLVFHLFFIGTIFAGERPSDFSIHQASGSVQLVPTWVGFSTADIGDGSSKPRPASFLTLHFNSQSPFYSFWGLACGVDVVGERVWVSQLRVNPALLDEESFFQPRLVVVSDIDRARVEVLGHWFVDSGELALHFVSLEMFDLIFESEMFLTLEFSVGEVVHRVSFGVQRDLLDDFFSSCV